MVFVTVGTHEQPFDRLIKEIDQIKHDGILDDDIIIQTGFSTYVPMYCKWSKALSYQEMVKNIDNARIVITHGGPASFIMPLQMGKKPIVVPRQKKFHEHVNDHQVDFTRNIFDRMGCIIPVYEIGDLKEIIYNYERNSNDSGDKMQSNNLKFNFDLEKIVWQILN